MKKILPMILLAAFSLPALADIELMCTITSLGDGKVTHEKETILDSDMWKMHTKECLESIKQPVHDSCVALFAGSTQYTETSYRGTGDHETTRTEIDRVDGKFKHWNHGDLTKTGTCVPFKAAF